MAAIKFKKDQVVIDEIKEFNEKVQAYANGTIDPEEFKHRRLLQGIYGQRQPKVFMVRIKIPAGHLSYDMIQGIIEATDLFAQNFVHITTRQDIQIYYVKLENLIPLLDKLADYGITTREASGATIRNIITSSFAGSLRSEAFDILPIVEHLVRYFLRNSETQHLPRKFKISVSESEEDLAVSSINDMGLIAKMKDGKPGFKIMLGGSLGSTPVLSRVYSEFVELNDLFYHVVGIIRAFNRYGDRAKRAEARLKFQFEKMGYEKFIELVNKEMSLIKEEKVSFPALYAESVRAVDFDFSNPFNKVTQPDKFNWFYKNVIPTRRENEYMITVQVPNGDLTTVKLQELSEAHKTWNDNTGEFLTLMDSQNLVLKGIKVTSENKQEIFNNIYKVLLKLDLVRMGVHTIADVITCMGSATCASGITHSPGLAEVLQTRLSKYGSEDDRFNGSTIHISGCANSCARHHVSTIGFSGRADKSIAVGQEAPAYNVFIGGSLGADGKGIIGTRVSEKILAKRIPEFLENVISVYENRQKQGETFQQFIAAMSKEEMNSILSEYTIEKRPIQAGEHLNYDWGKEKPYVMEYGEGECS